jgi:hypothetical protein
MASKNGELSWDDLSADYQFYWCFVGACVVGFMLIMGIILIFVALVHKPRQLKFQDSPSGAE